MCHLCRHLSMEYNYSDKQETLECIVVATVIIKAGVCVVNIQNALMMQTCIASYVSTVCTPPNLSEEKGVQLLHFMTIQTLPT